MKHLLYIFLFAAITLTLTACGGSSTGSDPVTYTVSVDMTPTDAGTVSPSLDEAYEEGKEIQLLANPGDDYVFTGWTGDLEGDVNPLPLTVSQDFSLTANFELKDYDLTITSEGEGSVQENVLEQKSKEYEHGTAVELIATPAQGYTFVEWKGDVSGSDNPAEITVDSPKEVTAVFEKKNYELAVTTEGSGAVSEQVVSKAKGYEYGDIVELSPSAAEGWKFVEWSGDLTGSGNPAQITIDTAKAVTAVFQRQTFALEVSIQGEGTIAKDPDQAEYEYGDKVTLTANPDANWGFKEWAGEISGSTPEITVTVHSERDITAVFEENPLFYLAKNGYTVVCPEAEPGEKGILNGEEYGTEYEAVDRAMLVQKIENNDDVTNVCTTSITDMGNLFTGSYSHLASFNRDIGRWDVSNVTKMDSLFYYAESFNQDIGDWDVSSVTDMRSMFGEAYAFNQDIGDWDVSNVTQMDSLFYFATDFNQDIGDWDVSGVEDMSSMFSRAESFDRDIGDWDVSGVTNMEGMFAYAASFNEDIGDWDVSGVTNMVGMFAWAVSFNQYIGDWDVSAVEDMSSMFADTDVFNRDINYWDVSNVETMWGMFSRAESFDRDIGGWDVSSVTDMSFMFNGTNEFNRDISGWDVSGVTDMSYMFNATDKFNRDISGWDVSGVTKMNRMFSFSDVFNQDIGGWNVSDVTDMTEMFRNASFFDQDLSGWYVPYICSEPDDFAVGAGFDPNDGTNDTGDANKQPDWGATCSGS